MHGQVKIIGHRGFPSQYAENSLIGFLKAAELGIDGVELDVHLTKDKQLVVHHDERIDRMTNGSGWLKEMTLEEVRRYDLKNASRWKTKAEKIPTLKEVFQILAPFPNLMVNIELKTNRFLYEGIEEKVLKIVEQEAGDRPIIYSSFHLPSIIRLKKLEPKAHIALITNKAIPHILDYLTLFEIDGIHPRQDIYAAHLETFQSLDFVRPWTVNRKQDMYRMYENKVDAIITKYPERALKLRQQIKEG